MTARKTFLLCAGGTGGHMFPAQALAQQLLARGHQVHMATDERASKYTERMEFDGVHLIESATFGSKNPFALLSTLKTLWRGYRQSQKLLLSLKPDLVCGFGGYPTLPPVFAAARVGVPTLIHEQNAVMGRANKVLSTQVSAVAGGFFSGKGSAVEAKTVQTGNPVREQIVDKLPCEYESSNERADFNLLVFGGSQGARYFGQTVPAALALLDEQMRQRVRLVLQARDEDVAEARKVLDAAGVSAEVSPFFDDISTHMSRAHLIISRSGASTVSEVTTLGRPAIFVPYPYALDHDQAENAAQVAKAGGVEVIKQSELDADQLAERLGQLIANPQTLTQMAHASGKMSHARADDLLADLVEAMASGQSIEAFQKDHLP